MKTILVDAINTFVILDEGIDESIHKLLESYPNRKIILTMAPLEKYEELGLDKVPYELYTTSFDPKKAEPTYYKQMLENFSLNKDDVVYFEHSPKAVESARSVDILTHHFDPEKRDLNALKTFLDENLCGA